MYFSVESNLKPLPFHLIVGGPHDVTMPDGRNVRKTIADVIHAVQQKILQTDEGDTKSIKNIISVNNNKCFLFVLFFNLR